MIKFDKCFPMKIIKEIVGIIPKANRLIKDLSKDDVELPDRIQCLSDNEIREYKKTGGGHGLFIPPNIIKINPYMNKTGILLNYIHENIHYTLPHAHENLVDLLTDIIAYQLKMER